MYSIDPLYGDWPFDDFPPVVEIDGQIFVKTIRKQPYSNVVEQYRQEVPRNSAHMLVLDDGHWIIDHVDEYNPDMGFPVRHFMIDHSAGRLLLYTSAGLVTMAIAVIRGSREKTNAIVPVSRM